MKFTPKEIKKEVNVTAFSPWKEFFTLFAWIAGILIAIYLILGISVSIVVKNISFETEKQIIDIIPKWHEKYVKDKGKRDNYLQSLMDRINEKCARLPYKIEVYELKSDKENAAAFPGYTVMVLSALLDKAKSENEIAFVLAHELGHYKNRDHLRKLGRSLVLLVMSTAFLASDSQIPSSIGESLQATEMRFSQTEEIRADLFALEQVNCLYGHVGGATDFFKRLDKIEKSGYGDYFFSSHPMAQKRIEKINKYSAEKKFKTAQKTPKEKF